MRGWVYVITNKAMPGLVKVGYTLKDPELRARELDSTGIPHPYLVEYEALVHEPKLVEQQTHKILTQYSEGKEWFKCGVAVAIAHIREIVGINILLETDKSGEPRAAAPTRTNVQTNSNDLYFCPVCHARNMAPGSRRVAICKNCGTKTTILR